MTASAFSELTKGKVSQSFIDTLNLTIEQVEQEIRGLMTSSSKRVSDIGNHTVKAGGKRLRPAFVALSAAATGKPFSKERVNRVGACMEVIHMASLIHDDIIDKSLTRRGKPTAVSLYGSPESVLSGDALLGNAMVALAEDGDLEIIKVVAESVQAMAAGEVEEHVARGEFDLDTETYLRILDLKTASFIRACCEVGGIIAGASPEQRTALRDYGQHVGMAFQLVDDILDYRGKDTETGKPHAIDFRDGQATLPFIVLRDQLSEAERQVLRSRFGNGVSDDEVRMICSWMESRGSFKESDDWARSEADAARTCLEKFEESQSIALLRAFVDFTLERRA